MENWLFIYYKFIIITIATISRMGESERYYNINLAQRCSRSPNPSTYRPEVVAKCTSGNPKLNVFTTLLLNFKK